ncbi:hypothetical protein KXD97_26145 [Mycobacterium sp. SMC-8]|uniref:hypothetical protein n=1 Tax=Mycobacterium sp. SMC-8 TaxID=2857060 RepID=UPI0021B2C16C|nr:hypothetical protein [Mycobacterium sp. SMC-8]UXA11460.1 hypothetical protein KXD97_26145 [Mycobacterium sp. SMC-8]
MTTNWRDPRHPDHYYWLTSRLEARGARVTLSRIVASWMIVGGLTPTLIVFGTTSSTDLPLRRAAIGVSIASGLTCVLWIRGTWPTRIQSAICVCIGTALIAITSLIIPVPLLSLVACVPFIAVAAYTAILHSDRTTVLYSLASAMVIVISAVELAATEPALAAGIGITITLSMVSIAVFVRALIGLSERDPISAAIEPVTGLLSHDGFQDGVAITIAARGRIDDRYFVIVHVGLDNLGVIADFAGAARARQLRVQVARMIRERARRRRRHRPHFRLGISAGRPVQNP